MSEKEKGVNENNKKEQLDQYKMDNSGKHLTTNQGLKVSEDEHSLKAGLRGPTLLEDFHFREKMTHFDHERIPERVVHARGYAAHGYFQPYESMKEYTKAKFLQDPEQKTPVFVRFSTVAGSKGSADTVRDIRGFATKFYTEEGNYDLVGNNAPVFFIQDAIKFPDLVHAFKPEPHNGIPQAQTAHDTFWDFVANNNESLHAVMWAMSDRGIPRSFRMMEGFGVHTFRFVNDKGEARFVKFHWKPANGIHSLVWDEAQKVAGKDPDFHRKDLWESIENGDYPEWELGVQMIEEKDEFKFDFDILDPTKLWPEEDVPVKLIGKMTLDRNVDNFFAETEQVAMHPGSVVPGIDFTNDPLLQGRLFSYTDTQLIRLGGPNFHEIPVNRPVCPIHNNQYDGYNRMTINTGQVSYHKNSLQNNDPSPAPPEEGGYEHYQEKVDGHKIRRRSDSFKDFFSQAKLFWNSLTDVEKDHLAAGVQFEVSKVKSEAVKQQVVETFSHVDTGLSDRIAEAVGVEKAKNREDARVDKTSPALSQLNSTHKPATRKVAVVAAEGFDDEMLGKLEKELKEAGATAEVVSLNLGTVKGVNGNTVEADHSFHSADSVLFDAVYVAGGKDSVEKLKDNRGVKMFLHEAYYHFKAVGTDGEGKDLLEAAGLSTNEDGVVTDDAAGFVEAVGKHRHWSRQV